jgi:hypothetical protein
MIHTLPYASNPVIDLILLFDRYNSVNVCKPTTGASEVTEVVEFDDFKSLALDVEFFIPFLLLVLLTDDSSFLALSLALSDETLDLLSVDRTEALSSETV